MNKKITTNNSICPICHAEIIDDMVTCPRCETVYHPKCIEENSQICVLCDTYIDSSNFIAVDTEQALFVEEYEIIVPQSQGITIADAIIVNQTFEEGGGKYSLREWWHSILRNHRKFSCYAIFLVLPSDKQALQYLTEFGKELDQISEDDCLILVLGGTDFRRSGFDKKLWKVAVKQHIDDGYSVKIARLFYIKLSEFPALMLFRNIHNTEHVVVSLKDMDSSQISTHMRKIFSVISEAIKKNQNPLEALSQFRNNEKFQATSKGAISELRSFAGKTFEKAIEIWLTTMVK